MSGAGTPAWVAPASALASSERIREYSRRRRICKHQGWKGLYDRNSYCERRGVVFEHHSIAALLEIHDGSNITCHTQVYATTVSAE